MRASLSSCRTALDCLTVSLNDRLGLIQPLLKDARRDESQDQTGDRRVVTTFIDPLRDGTGGSGAHLVGAGVGANSVDLSFPPVLIPGSAQRQQKSSPRSYDTCRIAQV